MNKIMVFGYGSLINLVSASTTLHRNLEQKDIIQMSLNGYERIWNYASEVYSEKLNKNVTAVYLNIVKQDGKHINGIAFEINQEELNYLIKRERYYDLVDVSNSVDKKVDAKVYVFVCTDSAHIAKTGDNVFVMQRYIDIVENGCKLLGQEFYKDYLETTQPIPFEIVTGDYKFN